MQDAPDARPPGALTTGAGVLNLPEPLPSRNSSKAHTGPVVPKRVTIVGSGNWGCAIAKIIAENTARHPEFHDEVTMWMFEEMVEYEGEKHKLSEVFNKTKMNIKYLPGIKLPSNIRAEPDVKTAADDADILVWVVPHQFVERTVKTMGNPKPGAMSVSLIKGGLELEGGKLGLCSDSLRKLLNHSVSVLMGANVANEVAQGQFCEATLGCDDLMTEEQRHIAVKLFDTPEFHVRAVQDVPGVELCGALKNVVALGAGFCDGLSFGGNTKAAIIRIGLQEMTTFIRHFYPEVQDLTFLESCGVADLVTTCFGGRNRKCAEAFTRAAGKKSWEEIENELLGGQKLQGTLTAQEIWPVMKEHNLCERLPLLTTIYEISFEGKSPSSIVELPEVLLSGGRKRVTIVGSGNWGCAIAKIVGENTRRHPDFHDEVRMWMFEEKVQYQGEQRNLSEVFNKTNENVKYLPGIILPSNVRAEPDVKKATDDADILVWVLPHQFVPNTVKTMGPPKPGAMSVSLIKGGLELHGGELGLCSDLMRKLLGHNVSVLMGANVANEVAEGQFCEATLGCDGEMTDIQKAVVLKLFDSPSFRVRAVNDVPGVELCGALKNVVALGAGFCDGLDFGGNTKAAIIRIGLQEMTTFIRHFYPQVKDLTFLESCGVADLITTCFGGRNRKCAEAYVRAAGNASWEKIEEELLNGQKLQGTLTAQEIWPVMQKHKLCEKLPLLTTIYQIAFENKPASSIAKLAPVESGKQTPVAQVHDFEECAIGA